MVVYENSGMMQYDGAAGHQHDSMVDYEIEVANKESHVTMVGFESDLTLVDCGRNVMVDYGSSATVLGFEHA